MGIFAERFDLMEVSGQLHPTVRRVTEDLIAELETRYGPLTEENAGMLVSHLALSLERLRRSEELAPDPMVVDEAARYPAELAAAARLVDRACALGAGRLPAGEIAFLALHIRALHENKGGA